MLRCSTRALQTSAILCCRRLTDLFCPRLITCSFIAKHASRMTTAAPSHRERRFSFSSTIRTLLQDVSLINARSASTHPSQKQNLQRLSSVLVTLEDSLRQADALPRESDDSCSLETIFNLLFSGLDDTIRYAAVWFQDSSPLGQTRAAERLEARVIYHVKAATLISTHLER